MITAYMKPTNYCNIGCDHCYLTEEVRANKFRMTWDTMEKSANLLKDMMIFGGHESAHVLWHGGEPMTVPAEWYDQAGEILDRVIPEHTQSIQTSLIPYKPDFAPIIRDRFHGYIGSSIDFSQRTIKGAVDNYHHLWLQKVDMCRQEGFTVIPGMVPTVKEVGRMTDILHWFVDHEFEAFNIDRYNNFGFESSQRPTNMQHSRILIELFDACMGMLERRGSCPYINVIGAGLKGVMYGEPGDRWGGSCQSDFVVIEPDGKLNNCPDKVTHEDPYGYAQDGFKSFAANPKRREWIRNQHIGHKRPHCASCDFNHFCKSGCPLTPNGWLDGEDECAGYSTYLQYVKKFLGTTNGQYLSKMYLNLQKNGYLDPYAVSSVQKEVA